MDNVESPVHRILYHHRTQGKAVEGIHIRSVTDALRELGVQVDVVSLPGADPYASPKAMSPTRQARPWMRVVSRLPEPMFELAELAYNLVAAVRLLLHLRRRPAQMIYERYSLFLIAGVLVARWKLIVVILEVNDATFVYRVRPLYFAKLAGWLERWVFRNCDGLVFVSGVFRDRARSAHPDMAPAIVSPNAANLSQFSFTPQQREQARARLGLEDSVVCGYLGAFVPWHAIDRFVYRIAEDLSSHPRLKLLLVGDGATFDRVREFVVERGLQSRVVLTGRVPHDEVPALLAAMDLAVLPNAGDYTSPVKLFEFMACGIAPIAPDFEPVREVLVDGRNGWLFKAGDIDDAVRSVLVHAENPDELCRVGAEARDYVGRERQWRNNALQLLELHSQVTTRRERGVST